MYKPKAWLLLKLSVEPRKRKRLTRKPCKGKRVIKRFLDLYLQNVVAPNHLPREVRKRLIEVCFLQLHSVTKLDTLDAVLSLALERLGVRYQSLIFNITPTELKTWYWVAYLRLFLWWPHWWTHGDMATILKYIQSWNYSLSFLQLHVGSRQFNLITWMPWSTCIESEKQISYWSWEPFNKLHETCAKALRYLSTCSGCVNRPNSHLLFELYMHSMQLYAHTLHVSDLVLESIHQPLTVALKKSCNSNALISSVNRMLFCDWPLRICDIWRLSLSGDSEHSVDYIYAGWLVIARQFLDLINFASPTVHFLTWKLRPCEYQIFWIEIWTFIVV